MQIENIELMEDLPIGIRINNVKHYPPHWHDDVFEIIFVIKGTVEITFGHEDFTMNRDDFLVIRHNKVHMIKSECKGNIVVSLFFDLKYFEAFYEYIDYIEFICESFNQENKFTYTLNSIRNNIILILKELNHKTDEYKEKINKYSKTIVDILMNDFTEINVYNESNITSFQLERIFRIEQMLYNRFTEKITLEDICKEEYINKTYLSQLIKQVSTWNFQDTLNYYRVIESEKLLLSTNSTIQEISTKCGFSDSKYYYKYFKKWYKCTPSEHRKKLKKNISETSSYDEVELNTAVKKLNSI